MDHLYSTCNAFNVERLCLNEQKLLEQPRIEDCTKTSITLQSLPVEILLHMFLFLELKPYIISHGVCKDWQGLLPLVKLHPIRRRLLALYHQIINTPHFERSLTWSLENLEPFDRQAYIDSLLSQYPAIPEEFPLLIWRTESKTDWLVFAEDERDLFGRVYITDFMDLESSAVIPHGRSFNFVDDSDDESDGYINIPYADWVSYLEHHWEVTAHILRFPDNLNRLRFSDWLVQRPVTIGFDGTLQSTLPTFPWNLRDTISHLALFN
ncbi:hypothetical protein CVT25_008991 [Psilocybe cyanescens]|uniref:F-box domain-containing protein n=1 Tax=Psilocybe cyanescens TaxID=93625 RepID=A0A409XN49_PSICY|nr:hypothetical protein CVT25_008991 [Psilocybe cyanescens]